MEEIRLEDVIGGHVRLDADPGLAPKGMFQCFLTNSHGHFSQSRVDFWRASGLNFSSSPAQPIVHASYVTYPWSSKEETAIKSISDIHYASICANTIGIWGLNIHLPKEYHLSTNFRENVDRCIRVCEHPCILLFELVGASTTYVREGRLPKYPIDRLFECQKVIDEVAPRAIDEVAPRAIDEVVSKMIVEGAPRGGSGGGGSTASTSSSISVDRSRKLWGFCLDTAHAFVQGQPLTTREDALHVIQSIEERKINVRALHLNGSLHPIGSGRDQHAVLASSSDLIWGKDDSGLREIVRWVMRKRIPTVLEVPGYSSDIEYTAIRSRLRSYLGK